MKKLFLFVLSVFSFAISFGQGAPPPGYAPKVFSYGNWYNRLRADSAQHIPNKAGLVLNDNDTTPQLFVFADTLRLFANGTFRNVTGGTGGTTYTADETSIHLTGTVFGIKNTWTGQTSITTLGTITTGIWNSTAITDPFISSAAAWNAKQTSALTSGAIWIGVGGVATALTPSGDWTINTSGVSTLASTIAPGNCTSCNITYDAKGRITVAANGTPGSAPFPDNSAIIKNNADNTRLLILDASLIATATTRTWKFPNVNGTVARIDAAQTFTGTQSFLSAPNFTGSSTTGYVWTATDNAGNGGWAVAATSGMTSLTGDITGTGPGATATTLATVNGNVGTWGDATHVSAFTVNAKGLVTAVTSTLITGLANSSLTNSSITISSTDFSGTGSISLGGTATVNINSNAVTNAKLAQMVAHTYKGNNTGSTANAADITNTQLTADLNVFTSSLKGLAPASGGGTVNFLRADGTYAPATANIGGTTPNLMYKTATGSYTVPVVWDSAGFGLNAKTAIYWSSAAPQYTDLYTQLASGTNYGWLVDGSTSSDWSIYSVAATADAGLGAKLQNLSTNANGKVFNTFITQVRQDVGTYYGHTAQGHSWFTGLTNIGSDKTQFDFAYEPNTTPTYANRVHWMMADSLGGVYFPATTSGTPVSYYGRNASGKLVTGTPSGGGGGSTVDGTLGRLTYYAASGKLYTVPIVNDSTNNQFDILGRSLVFDLINGANSNQARVISFGFRVNDTTATSMSYYPVIFSGLPGTSKANFSVKSETNRLAGQSGPDDVLSIGYGLDASDSGRYIRTAWESNYRQPGNSDTARQFEYHLEIGYTAPSSLTNTGIYRPMSWTGSRTQQAGQWLLHADSYSFMRAPNDTIRAAFASNQILFQTDADGALNFRNSRTNTGLDVTLTAAGATATFSGPTNFVFSATNTTINNSLFLPTLPSGSIPYINASNKIVDASTFLTWVAGTNSLTLASTAVFNITSNGNNNFPITATAASSGSYGSYFRNTTNTAYTRTILENNRGSLANYLDLAIVGSTSSAFNTVLGIASAADWAFLHTAGANNAGLAIGTGISVPLVFSTNNLERARFFGGGNLALGSTTDNAAILQFSAGTTAKAQLYFASSTAPTSPTAGMVWNDGTNLVFKTMGLAPATTLVSDLGTSSTSWRDLYIRHIVTTGSAPTFHAGSLGTNVTSVTPSRTDGSMHVIIVTSGAVTGTIGSIDYATTWGSAPVVGVTCTSNSTGSAAVPIVAAATSGTLLVLSGVIAGAGTYEYDIISQK